MSQKITHDQKETALEARRTLGTMKAAALIAGISVRTLNEEMRRSAVFKKRMTEAAEEGHNVMGDNAIQVMKDYADGHCTFCHGSKTILEVVCSYCNGTGLAGKTDRNRLTAAIAIANWVVPGFKAPTIIQGRIDHDVRVITAVPRPNYLEAPKTKLLNNKTVEDVIEGEVIKENDN